MNIIVAANLERWTLCQNDEEDDCCSEYINGLTVVLVTSVDLWGHVGDGAELGLEESASVPALGRCRESEISNLNIVVFVQHDILWFQIAMADALVMAVGEGLHHLDEEESSCLF